VHFRSVLGFEVSMGQIGSLDPEPGFKISLYCLFLSTVPLHGVNRPRTVPITRSQTSTFTS
jgi:hypothetical protein